MDNITLNRKLWTADNKLRPEVRDKILKISDAFRKYTELPIDIIDIHLVGSNASYNYNDTSDLDVHFIVNFDTMTASPEVLQTLFQLQKSSFNDKYDISIHGVPIEVYVEDVSNSSAVSNGIYSIMQDNWIKFPTRETVVLPNVDTLVNKWAKRIEQILSEPTLEKVNQAINTLYLIRKNSISADGEYGKGNTLFKKIRSLGLLDLLKAQKTELESEELSLESLERGE